MLKSIEPLILTNKVLEATVGGFQVRCCVEPALVIVGRRVSISTSSGERHLRRKHSTQWTN